MSNFNRISMLDEMLNNMRNATLEPGKNKPGMRLQRWEHYAWVYVLKNGKVVKSPVNFVSLPHGRYRLV